MALACFVAWSAGCVNAAVSLSESRWSEVRMEQIRLIGDVEPAQLVRLGRELSLFRRYLRQTGMARWPAEIAPFTVVVVGDTRSYEVFTSSRFVAGWFTPALRGSWATANLDAGRTRDAEGAHVLFHEYVHFLLAYNAGFVYPLWYEEGLAEYLSTFQVDDGGGIDVGLPKASRIRELNMNWEPLGRLLTDGPVSYPHAWLAVHYMYSTPPRDEQLISYLTLYDAGNDAFDAFARAFDVSEKTLREEIRAYYRRGQYPYVHFEPGELGGAEPPRVREMTETEVLVDLGALFLNARADVGTARHLFGRALEIDPTSAESNVGMAAVSFASGDLDRAATHLAAVFAAAPDHAWAHTIDGHLHLHRAEQEGKRDAAVSVAMSQARAAYRRAIEAAPNVPEPYRGIAATYPEDSSQAIDALEAARRLQPLHSGLALDLAERHVDRAEFAKARRLLEWVLTRRHRASEREARRILAELERRERALTEEVTR